MKQLEEGDYVFSLPRVTANRPPEPIAVGEVASTTNTRCKLDNGAEVQREVRMHDTVYKWGSTNETYQFTKHPMVAVRRQDYAEAKARLDAERQSDYLVARIHHALAQRQRTCRTPGDYERLTAELLLPVQTLLDISAASHE